MPDPQLSDQELAARYGFAMAVLNSNPELKGLFQRAVAQTYTPERFQAELRATDWFKKTSDHARNFEVLKASDPATFQGRMDQVRTRMMMMASELGAQVPSSQVGSLAEQFYKFAYDDNQIRQTLSQYVQYTSGRMVGQAGQWEQEWREYAAQMGMRYSDSAYQTWAKNAVGGKMQPADVLSKIQQDAISANPHLADQLRGGQTVQTIAEPYRQTMARLWEVNPESVDVFDPTIRKALGGRDERGNPTLRTLYDFENDLRKDSRWLKTKNAQDAASNTVNRVLRDMGVVS